MKRRGTPPSAGRRSTKRSGPTRSRSSPPRYGLSDVGLVKICKKLGIPVPGRGYWAKVKAACPTRKAPPKSYLSNSSRL